MKIEIPVGLKRLAEIFPMPLYIVGGYVRDAFLGFKAEDADIASALPPDKVKETLKGTEFAVIDASKKLLTLIIKDGERSYEYTTFREDSYTEGHRPSSVKPCCDLETDAKRRDFTVNAIYYDILKGETIDPLNGLEDLKNKTLKTTRSPKEVFSEDGLRLMRLARFAASLDFQPEKEVIEASRENARLIEEISVERVKDELDKILVCDGFYGVENAQTRGIELLTEIGVTERILPELTLGIGMEQRADYHAYDVFTHTLMTVKAARKDIRLAALLHDVGKPKAKIETGRFSTHAEVGAKLTKDILTRLRYPKNVIEETVRLVANHMFNLKDDASEDEIRLFWLRNRDIKEKLIELKKADMEGSGREKTLSSKSVEHLEETYERMRKEGVPFGIKELKVNGEDLKEMTWLPKEKRGDALNCLLEESVKRGADLDTKEKQINLIKNFFGGNNGLSN